MKFAKMHGLGNDYILLNGLTERIENPENLAKNLCQRRFGIGSDGLLLVESSIKAPLKMRMFNPDGSEAEMCGNGLRCFSHYAYEKRLLSKTCFEIETKAGLRKVNLEIKEGKVQQVQISMGVPQLERTQIPMKGKRGTVLGEKFRLELHTFEITAISMGNPHIVLFVEDVAQFPVEKWGPLFERDPRFPEGVNIEFVQQISPQTLIQRTWERGCGETYACGTGACAAGVAGILLGKIHSPVTIQLKGGPLHISWEPQEFPVKEVVMSGPSKWVYEGEINPTVFIKEKTNLIV